MVITSEQGDDDLISKFMNLEPEKRERIINAALDEFARKKYKNASTNEIVKNANISKGLLFHYFNNKKSLYLFIFDYSLEVFANDFYNKLDFEETDILKRMKQVEILKLELIHKYPSLYDFMKCSVTDDSEEIKQELEDKTRIAAETAYRRLFENIDVSLFKDGFDPKSVINMIIWVIQGFGNNAFQRIRQGLFMKSEDDIKVLYAEFDSYIELLRKAYYK